MKYEIKYTLQKEVTVTVDVCDENLNKQYDELGEITSDKDFIENDPRWGIEQIGFDCFNGSGDGELFDDIDNEAIIDRTIRRV